MIPIEPRRFIPRVLHAADGKGSGSTSKLVKPPFRREGEATIPRKGKGILYTSNQGHFFAILGKNSMVFVSRDKGSTWIATGCTDRFLVRALETKVTSKTDRHVTYFLKGKGSYRVTAENEVLKNSRNQWKPANADDTNLFKEIHTLKESLKRREKS